MTIISLLFSAIMTVITLLFGATVAVLCISFTLLLLGIIFGSMILAFISPYLLLGLIIFIVIKISKKKTPNENSPKDEE